MNSTITPHTFTLNNGTACICGYTKVTNTYTVTFNTGSGATSVPAQQVQAGKSPVNVPSSISRTGYTFLGWTASSNVLIYTGTQSYLTTAQIMSTSYPISANTTYSAVRITHLPSGISVQCQNERSQFQNKDKAMQMLKAKLYMLKQEANAEKLSDIRGEVKEIGWGSQIRSYVFMPYTLVKDHRTGFENGNITAVMDGDIDGFINAYLTASATGELKK